MNGENKNKPFPKVWEAALLILLLPIIVPLAVVGLILHTLNRFIVPHWFGSCSAAKRKNVLFVSSVSSFGTVHETQIALPLVEHRLQ